MGARVVFTNVLRTGTPSLVLVRPERRALAFFLNLRSLHKTSPANVSPVVLLTVCPNGHPCSVGEVSLGIRGAVCGAQTFVPLNLSRGPWGKRLAGVVTF